MPSTNFDAVPKHLTELMKEIADGRTQLLDFQRNWKWTDEQITSLIASVTQSFPIHSILTLEAGGSEAEFKSRPFSGTSHTIDAVPEALVLDGQQRLTSLFQATTSGDPVKTFDSKGNNIERHYYLDMAKCVDTSIDREDAVISVPGDRIFRDFQGGILVDLTNQEQEFRLGWFPLSEAHRSERWLVGYLKYWEESAQEKLELYENFKESALEHLQTYSVPVIRLGNKTPIEAVCNIFIKVNTGGIQLNEFELLTAKFAAHGFDLRTDWKAKSEELLEKPVLSRLSEMDFIRAITLLATTARGTPSVRPRDIMRLTIDDYRDWADATADAFVKSIGVLHELKIFEAQDVPYGSQVTALAAILARVQVIDKNWESAESRSRLARWFWNGVFGEMYGGDVGGPLRRDCAQVPEWLIGSDEEPETITSASFAASRLRSLRSRQSAAYKGVYALLMQSGAEDFATAKLTEEQQFANEKIEIHHIFPKKWCTDHGYVKDDFDSVINRTPLSARANRQIGKEAPSAYLPLMQGEAKVNEKRMDAIIRTHRIDPELLRADDFEEFYKDRGEALIAAIEAAMKKPAVRADADFDISSRGRS